MIKKQLISLFLFAFILSTGVMAQEEAPADTSYWNSGGNASLTFSQVSLTNWAGGGQNSVAFNSGFALFADKKKDRVIWRNSLDLGYGLVKQGDAEFQKSDDRINFVTTYSRRIKEENSHWFFSGLLDFRTQFDEGFSSEDPDSVISRFFSPAYLLVSSGIEYAIGDVFTVSYSPVTGKVTFVTDPDLSALGAYGVDPGSTVRTELGSFFRMKYKNEIVTNVELDSRLELFTSYENESFGNIDVNWQNAILLKVNEYISATFFTQLIYDDDIKIEVDDNSDGIIDSRGPRTQFKSVLGIGLAYKFGAKRDKE